MERISIQKTNRIPNFIGAWMITDPTLCDSMINYFELNNIAQCPFLFLQDDHLPDQF